MVIALSTLFSSTLVLSQEDGLTVSAETMASLVFYPSRSAPANVLSLNNSQIAAEISALVISIPVRVGDIVEAGDVLALLDCRQAKLNHTIEASQVARLKDALDFDSRELERQETLVTGGNIGESAFDRIQTDVLDKNNQLLAQQALLNIAELNVERCSITAPYAGVVSARLASEGERMTMGAPVVQLVQVDELEVMANIALDDVASFRAAEAYVFQHNGSRYPLTIRSLVPMVESNARIREARLVFSNETSIAGSSGRLIWETPLAHVPARFLQLRDKVPGIFIVENNSARFVPLPDAEEGRPVQFDMNEATLLITDGRFGLRDGQAITVR